jgi:four helix bundle protein
MVGRKVVRVEDLDVWRRAHQLVLKIYEGTRDFPQEEKFTLVSQMRRSAISIPANVAEGFRRNGLRDKVNFYNIAQSSLDELRYYVILSRDLGYISDISEIVQIIDEVGALLGGLVKATRARSREPEARSRNPGASSQGGGKISEE